MTHEFQGELKYVQKKIFQLILPEIVRTINFEMFSSEIFVKRSYRLLKSRLHLYRKSCMLLLLTSILIMESVSYADFGVGNTLNSKID